MKATIKEQAHRATVRISEVRFSKIQDVSAEAMMVKVEFLATHFCKVVDGQEVSIAMASPVVFDEISQTIPFDLWVGLRKAIESNVALESVNDALLMLSSQFTNSLEGFELQLETVELG